MFPFTVLETLVPAVALALLTWVATNLTATRRLSRRIQRDLAIASQLPPGRARARIEVTAERDADEYGRRRARGVLRRTWWLFVLACLTALSYVTGLVFELIAYSLGGEFSVIDFVVLPLFTVLMCLVMLLDMRRRERRQQADRVADVEVEVERRQRRPQRTPAPLGSRPSGTRVRRT